MEQQQPIAGNGDASTLDRIEAWLGADAAEGQDEQPAAGQPDAKQADKPDAPKDDVPEQDTGPQFTTQHLAEHLGIDPEMVDVDDEGQPIFKAKVDGKEATAKFKDLLADYQKRGSADNRLREAAEREKAAERKMQEAEQAIAQRHQQLSAQLQDVATLAMAAQQELNLERSQYNLAEIAQNDPARAIAVREYLDQKQARINGMLQNIAQRKQAVDHAAKAQQEANERKAVESQSRRLLELVPEWKDPQTFQKERAALISWMEKAGIEPGDVDLNKASQVYLLRKSWQQDTLQSTKPDIEKKLKAAPKLVKPGTATQKPDTGEGAKLKDLKRQARTNGQGSTRAAMDYLLATGKA